MKGASLLAGALALLAAGLLLVPLAQLSPALAAVTCGSSWEQGTLDANGNWTPGSGTDYRVVCTADTDGEVFDVTDLPLPLPAGAARHVIDLSDPNIDRDRAVLAFRPATKPGVVTGTLVGSSSGHAVDIDLNSIEPGGEGVDFVLESFATISASGDFRRGIEIVSRAVV